MLETWSGLFDSKLNEISKCFLTSQTSEYVYSLKSGFPVWGTWALPLLRFTKWLVNFLCGSFESNPFFSWE